MPKLDPWETPYVILDLTRPGSRAEIAVPDDEDFDKACWTTLGSDYTDINDWGGDSQPLVKILARINLDTLTLVPWEDDAET